MFSVADLRTALPNLPDPVISSIRYDAKGKQVSVIDVFRVLTGPQPTPADWNEAMLQDDPNAMLLGACEKGFLSIAEYAKEKGATDFDRAIWRALRGGHDELAEWAQGERRRHDLLQQCDCCMQRRNEKYGDTRGNLGSDAE